MQQGTGLPGPRVQDIILVASALCRGGAGTDPRRGRRPLGHDRALRPRRERVRARGDAVIDSITPHVVSFTATRELLRRHQEGLPSGMELADMMATSRELGEVGGFEGLSDIERATTERGT